LARRLEDRGQYSSLQVSRYFEDTRERSQRKIGDLRVLESNERATIRRHICTIKVSSKSSIAVCLREQILEINVVQRQSTAISLLAVDNRREFVLAGAGRDTIAELNLDLVLREIIGETGRSS